MTPSPASASSPAPALAGTRRGGLHADAVPFPFGGELFRIERREIGFLDGMRQHRRAERREVAGLGFFGAAFEPGEQLGVGRRQARPEDLNLVRLLVAE